MTRSTDHLEAVLTPRPPFDFSLTAGYQTYFQEESGADVFRQGVYRRVLDIDGRPVLASVSSLGSTDAPRLQLTLNSDEMADGDLAQAQETLTWMFALNEDLDDFYSLAQGDPLMDRLTTSLRGLHPPRVPAVLESLTLAIAAQQISGKVARTLRTRLIQSYGPSLEVDGLTYYGFPSPQALAHAGIEGLRSLGFSGRKSEYIAEIAQAVAMGTLDLEGLRELSDAEVAERLIALRGVGEWTVHWVMGRALGRGDAFPGDDLALRRTLSRFYFAGEPISAAQANALAQRWGPYRAHVICYLFAALRQGMAL